MIDKTVLGHIKISDCEITRRKELLGLGKKDLELLVGCQLFINENVDAIVGEFYRGQMEVDEISLLIGDTETLARLKKVQREYILDLFSGKYGSDYVNNRLRIGIVHKQIGVEPKLYLSSVLTLKNIINCKLKSSIKEQDVLDSTIGSLDKLFYFDTTLIMDTYIGSLVGEIEADKKRIEIYAQLDSLTNIYHQGAMRDYLEREILLAKRSHKKLSLVYFDLDNFKDINDKNGHIKGDEVLKNIGGLLLKNIRETDVACRYGGDEFCIIFPDCDVANAKISCEKIIKEFKALYPEYFLSIGISETGTDSYCDGEDLIKKADEHMYVAKQEKGFQISY